MTVEVTAKKIDDAIKQGLEQLGIGLDEVNVEVLESGGLFKKAKVRLTLEREEDCQTDVGSDSGKAENKQSGQPSGPADNTERKSVSEKPVSAGKPQKTEDRGQARRPENQNRADDRSATKKPQDKKPERRPDNNAADENAKGARAQGAASNKTEGTEQHKNDENYKAAVEQSTEFITQVISKMGFTDCSIAYNPDTDMIEIDAPAGDDSLIIGRHGEMLSAVSFLAETLGRAEKPRFNIAVDCNGYRERRAASLTAMARRRADECISKNRKIKLEPMERIDRRTVHNALNDDGRVSTVSEGKEPYRYIVILPKR